MKLGRKKQPAGRQRRESPREAAPSAYSYHAQRSSRPDTPERQQSTTATKRSKMLSMRYLVKRSGSIALVFVVIISAISLLSLSSSPRIILLDEGNTFAFRDAELYEQSAANQLSSSIWNRNKVTVSTAAASDSLKKQFPEIAEVNVTLPLIGHRPIYYIQANAPAFVIQAVNGTFVLDASGKSLLAKDGVPESTLTSLPVITDQTGTRVEAGKQIISRSNTQFIQTVLATLAAKNVTVESLVLPASNVQQLNVKITGKAYIVKFDMHESGGARQQVGSYLATQATLDSRSVAPSQYIDVRVLGRTYYL